MDTALNLPLPTTATPTSENNAYLESIGKIFFHVYASSAVRAFSVEELGELLAKSRKNNTVAGISGMLLYKDGNFLQVLEGREAAVRRVIDKIAQDPRHRGVVTLLEGFENEYQFPDWSMSFRDLQSAEAKATPGFNDFLNLSLEPGSLAADPTAAQKLLLVFKRCL